MATIKVIHPGTQTTVQDFGRRGYQQYGVPVSGAMDTFSMRIANILVGNPEGSPVLEALILPPSLEFEADAVFAVTGALTDVFLNDVCVPMWRSISAKAGDRLTFKSATSGCWVYLAFAGGIDVPKLMNSTSTYLKGQFGGFEGRALRKNDTLRLYQEAELHGKAHRYLPSKWVPHHSRLHEIAVVLGPQDHAFSKEGIQTFTQSNYTVSTNCDRMGYRLDGPVVETLTGSDILSDGIVMGSVQIPGNGQPIIMMADRQTTGGYAKIATVITPHLRKIAQARPGDILRFQMIAIEDAHVLYQEEVALFGKIGKAIKSQTPQHTKSYSVTVNQKKFAVTVDKVPE